MREVVDKAKRNMGERFIQETTGHFWSTLSTRHMRAKRALGESLIEAGLLQDAIAVFERMLELNLTTIWARAIRWWDCTWPPNQPQQANSLFARYPDEERITGSLAWARVLERWLSGSPDDAEARAALERSRKVNRFAERYVSVEQPLPEESRSTTGPATKARRRCACSNWRPRGSGTPNLGSGCAAGRKLRRAR